VQLLNLFLLTIFFDVFKEVKKPSDRDKSFALFVLIINQPSVGIQHGTSKSHQSLTLLLDIPDVICALQYLRGALYSLGNEPM
jgi:hypothetical protein